MRLSTLRRVAHAVLTAGLLGLAGSCTDEPTSPRSASARSASAALATPPTLTWLAPLGTGVADSASFDPAAAPVVEVCAWSGTTCVGPLVARFTTVPAATDLPLTINAAAGRYEGAWSLADARFTTRRTYRIRVLQGDAELGARTVDVVRGRWALTRDDGTLAPLTAVTALPIQFSVKRAGSQSVDQLIGADGGEIVLPGVVRISFGREAFASPTLVTLSAEADSGVRAFGSEAPAFEDALRSGRGVRISFQGGDIPAVGFDAYFSPPTDLRPPPAPRVFAQVDAGGSEEVLRYLPLQPATGGETDLAVSVPPVLFTQDAGTTDRFSVRLVVAQPRAGLEIARATITPPAVTSPSLLASASESDLLSGCQAIAPSTNILAPLTRAREVATRYGAYGYVRTGQDGTPKVHPGVDLAAQLNTPVVAAANGTASWFINGGGLTKGYGLYVVIHHTDGAITLYGHLQPGPAGTPQSTLAPALAAARQGVDVAIRRGEQLGLSGQSGNASNEAPQLHFEYHPRVAPTVDTRSARAGWTIDPVPCQQYPTLEVTPDRLAIVVGQTAAASVATRDQRGTEISGLSYAWSSRNTAIASVQVPGANTARATIGGVAEGTAIVTVIAAGASAFAFVDVTTPTQPPPPDPVAGNVGYSFGDPHLQTIDGRRYDFQGVGDYRFSKSTEADDDFEVQTRFRPLSGVVSVNDGVAARVLGDVVNLFNNGSGFDIIVNDSTFTAVRAFARALPGGGTVLVDGSGASVSWPDRTLLTLARNAGVSLLLPSARSGQVEGLLGNYDGSPANDLRVRGGRQLDPSLAGLYGDFRESWYVPFGTPASLFRRAPAVPNPASFPERIVTLGSFDPQAVSAARATCRSAGVADPEVVDACAFDILVTGDNTWAAVAVQFDPTVPRLTVAPALAYLAPGERQTFSAAVQGLSRTAVTWTATGGTVATTAPNSMTYTAPSAPGEYTITARSVESGAVVASAQVTVALKAGGALTNGATHPGRIGSVGQIDTWTFVASAGDYLVASVGEAGTPGASFYPRVRILGPTGTVLESQYGSEAAQAHVTVPAAGTYTVLVDSYFAATGDYRLTVVKAPGTLTTSPDDQGGRLASGATATGDVYLGDVDGYTVTAGAGDYVVASVGEAGSSGASFYPRVRVIGPRGEVLDAQYGSAATQASVTAPTAGTYTVLVDTYFAAAGDYRLTVAVVPGAVTTSAGDQGGALASGALNAGNIYLGDVDVWTIDASRGDYLVASVGEVGPSGPSFYPRVRIVGPTGAVLASEYGSAGAQANLAAPTTGTYTVLVDTYFADAGGYGLTVVKVPGPLATSPGDQGGPAVSGATYAGAIPLGDVDAWTVDVAAGAYVVASVGEAGLSDPSFYPRIRIVGPDGQLLRSEYGSAGAQASVTAPAAGTYTVLVDTYFAASGGYRLTVTTVPGATAVSAGDQGGPLTSGLAQAGDIYLGDVDIWTVSVTSGSTVRLRMTQVGTASPDFYPRLRVVGPDGVLLAGTYGSEAAEVAFTAPAAGVYTVLADTYFAAAGTYSILWTDASVAARAAAPGVLEVARARRSGTPVPR